MLGEYRNDWDNFCFCDLPHVQAGGTLVPRKFRLVYGPYGDVRAGAGSRMGHIRKRETLLRGKPPLPEGPLIVLTHTNRAGIDFKITAQGELSEALHAREQNANRGPRRLRKAAAIWKALVTVSGRVNKVDAELKEHSTTGRLYWTIKLIPLSSMSADFSVNFDRDHGPVLDVNSGSIVGSSPRPALDFNGGLDTDFGPPLGINSSNNKLLFIHRTDIETTTKYTNTNIIVDLISEINCRDNPEGLFGRMTRDELWPTEIVGVALEMTPGQEMRDGVTGCIILERAEKVVGPVAPAHTTVSADQGDRLPFCGYYLYIYLVK
ncbi:hypothetical protein EVAR_88592_1 [Eumeta japonica]|uniref:Uncharacterized protein n=1 Tax=Eumeta variegata TaxID=151549 RepID=A0A4C1Y933_EUMVA|nr:hypothetical protein EVAR_88592_1 [Eumeta japonica]